MFVKAVGYIFDTVEHLDDMKLMKTNMDKETPAPNPMPVKHRLECMIPPIEKYKVKKIIKSSTVKNF
jgi:hypothetical protein